MIEVINVRADIRKECIIGRERLILKPVVTLPINTHVPKWSIREPWIQFYFERFTDPNEVFLRGDDPRKCGCQKVSCEDDMSKPKMACGFYGEENVDLVHPGRPMG